jgi:hypothetical protein
VDPALAHQIARERLAGHTTRAGEPFIDHVERVAADVAHPARTAAYLHDVLEHTDTSPDELAELGLDPLELATLNLLTRHHDESFEAHALRVAYAKGPEGVLARAVRRADLDDHLARMPATATEPYYWARRHVMR